MLKATILLLTFFSLVIPFPTDSTGNGKGSNPQQKPTTNQQYRYGPADTFNARFFNKPIVHDSAYQATTDNTQKEAKKKSLYDLLLVIFAGVNAIATCILIPILIGHLRAFNRQGISLQTTVEHGQIELRSYVSIDGKDVTINKGDVRADVMMTMPVDECFVMANLFVRNIGKTPASRIQYFASVKIFNKNGPANGTYSGEIKRLPDFTSGKEDVIQISENFKTNMIESLGYSIKDPFVIVGSGVNINNLFAQIPNDRLFFFGYVDFTDVFKIDWHTEFCFEVLLDGRAPILKRTADHNDTYPRQKSV